MAKRECLDCSYRGTKFDAGACPACGSLRIVKPQPAPSASATRKPVQLVLLVVLWSYLFYLIWQNVNAS